MRKQIIASLGLGIALSGLGISNSVMLLFWVSNEGNECKDTREVHRGVREELDCN